MYIKVDMPFKMCETCTDCSLRVEEQVLFGDDKCIGKEITVSCRNERLCKHIKQEIEEKGEQM